MAVQAEVRDYIAKVRERGYKVIKTGNSKHYKIIGKNGQPVTDEKGPLIISTSPGDHRWREMHVKRAMAVGIFSTDPFKETRGKKGPEANGDGAADDEDDPKRRQREATQRAAKLRSDEFGKRSRDLRARIEMMIVKLGGWNTGHGLSVNGVSVADFMRLVRHWLDKHQTGLAWPTDKGLPTSTAAAQSALSNLRKPDSTIGAKWLPLMEGFVDYLYAEDALDAEKAASRYRILVRETRGEVKSGITQRSSAPVEPGAGAARPPQREVVSADDANEEIARELGPAHTNGRVEPPMLAMRALFHMARDPDAGDSVIEIAHRIAELELNTTEQKLRRMG